MTEPPRLTTPSAQPVRRPGGASSGGPPPGASSPWPSPDEPIGDPTLAATRLARALVLRDQHRHDLAEVELRQALAADPADARPHAHLALSLSAQDRHDEAQIQAETAVRLDPELAFAHAALGSVLLARGRPARALTAVAETIRLDPESAHHRAQLAELHFVEDRPREALATAETGLALDPEHAPCAHLRALALLRLGRPAEAAAAISAVLRRDADDATAHAIRGWSLLETGDDADAETHLRTALRLAPDFGLARDGLAEALRARYPGYRRPSMARNRPPPDRDLPPWRRGQVRWAGFWLALIFAPPIAALAAVGMLLWAAWVTARGTWRLAADSAAALRLRRDPLGRHLYPPDRLAASSCMAACGLVAVAASLAVHLTGRAVFWLPAGWAVLMLLPVSSTFERPPGRGRTAMAALTIALAATGALAVLLVA